MKPNFKSYKNKKVLVTGHTGFKGTWLVLILKFFGAQVYGISLKPKKNSMYFQVGLKKLISEKFIDIRSYNELNNHILKIKPDFIFHLAAQALVKESYNNPLNTISTNIIGTSNVLDVARRFKHKCILIIITSDKCYKNIEQIWGYKECDELGGDDTYSASKASCEIIFNSYFNSYFKNNSKKIRISSVRAGNVIGGGDWSENRIIPDCVKSWMNNRPLKLNNPNSTRPWQHVLEPLFGYLKLALVIQNNKKLNGESFNFGPSKENSITVKKLVNMFKKNWKYSNIILNKSYKLKEQNLLRLDCTKVLKQINWKIILNEREMVEMTRNWYQHSLLNKKMLNFTNQQIKNYYDKFLLK